MADSTFDLRWASTWKELAQSATNGQPGSPDHVEMLAVKECRLAEMQDAIVHSSQALVDVTRLVWATALMSLATVILAVAAIVS